MSRKDILIYAAAGLSVWLNGAVTFRLGGRILFESGPWVTVIVALVIAALVCWVFQAAMSWRKTPASQAVVVAVIMALPGLFGETARQIVFVWATGLRTQSSPSFSAVIFFGNAVLLTYAVIKAQRAV